MSIVEGRTLLVTGGAGFVGSHVVEHLLVAHPREVIVVDNLLRGSRENMAAFARDRRVTFVEGDIRDRGLMERLVARSSHVLHLAALRITRAAEDHAHAFDVMVRATFDLCELAVKHGVEKVVYSSSASVYGLARQFPTPESENPYGNRTFYGAAKLFGETMLRTYAEAHGLRYVALRYFNVYGPRMDTEGRYTEVMIRWLECIRDGVRPVIHGDGSATMDFVYVGDVARANIAALESDVTDEAFNVGCQRETSLAELLATLLAVNASTLAPEHQKARKVNAVPRRLADISKARRLLGFEPATSLEEGLRRLSAWYFGGQGEE